MLSECQTVNDLVLDRHNVGPDLDLNYLQRLSADDKIADFELLRVPELA